MTETELCPLSSFSMLFFVSFFLMTQTTLLYAYRVYRYPVGMTLIQTLFSKILGARPQGTWMGWLVASGSVARIIGEIYGIIFWFTIECANMNLCNLNRSYHHLGRLHTVWNQLDLCCDNRSDDCADGEPFLYQRTHFEPCPARRRGSGD